MFEIITQAIVNGIIYGALFALIALGLTLIFGVMDIVNFAHGDFLMVSMYITFVLFLAFKLNPYVSLVVTVPAMFILGIVFYRSLIRPLLGRPLFSQVLATVGISIIFQNFALTLFGADLHVFNISLAKYTIKIGTVVMTFPQLVALFTSVLFTIVFYLILKRTDLGLAIQAASQNLQGCSLVGINVHRTNLWACGLGMACLGIAGPMFLPLWYVSPMVGAEFTLIAFVIIVLGGLGSFTGALIGGFIIGVAESVSAIFLSGSLAHSVTFILFILILLVRPQGLFGEEVRGK